MAHAHLVNCMPAFLKHGMAVKIFFFETEPAGELPVVLKDGCKMVPAVLENMLRMQMFTEVCSFLQIHAHVWCSDHPNIP